MAQIIDGKAVATKMKEQMKKQIIQMEEETGVVPGLAVILVGDDGASQIYVKNKEKACHEVGIYSEVYRMPAESTQQEVLDAIEGLNVRSDIDGILVQLPIPKQIEKDAVIAAISPNKDVDGFHPLNVGRGRIGQETFLPATAFGIVELLKQYNIEIDGKHCVVIGRSGIVGNPVANLMLQENATVTVCHSHTKNLAEICVQADILIAAAGQAGLITGDMIKEGAAVIDAGMNRDKNGKLCGDVDFEAAEKRAGFITPVPGGVGPMTITMLLHNTIYSANRWGANGAPADRTHQ